MELIIKNIALDLLSALKVEEATVNVRREETPEGRNGEYYAVEISSSDSPLLIGRHGESLAAFQHILKMIAGDRAEKEHQRKIIIRVDIDGYRKRQEEEAIDLARRRAEQVRTTGNPVRLPPMEPYFRRAVHLYLMNAGWDDIIAESNGFGSSRAIMIKKKT